MPRARRTAPAWGRALALALASCAWPAPEARAADVQPHPIVARRRWPESDSLGGLPIRRVRVESRNVFEPVPPGRLRPVYLAFDRLHIRTRASTVRSALVLHPGATWDEDGRAEAERRLRALRFLAPVSVTASRAADSVDVSVVTQDYWSTSPEINIERGGGQTFGSIALTERNLLGLGISLVADSHRDPVGASRLLMLDDPAIGSSHWRSGFSVGTGASGNTAGAHIVLPFWEDAAATSAGAAWSRGVSEAQMFSVGRVVAEIPRRHEETEVQLGTGRRAADGTIQRFISSFDAIDDRYGASRLEAGAPPGFAGPFSELRVRRVAGEMVLWRPHYIVRHAVDQMGRAEDFDVGPQFAFKTGFSPHFLGSTADEGYARLRLSLGANAGAAGFGLLRAGVEGRVRLGLQATQGQSTARWVWNPRPGFTGVFAGLYQAGWRMPRDFQQTLGGLTGLRAFGVNDLAGTETERINAEFRLQQGRDWLDLVRLGAAAFFDTGRARGLGSGEEGWHSDAGLGLRLALPHAAFNSIVRIDVAWPLAPGVDTHHGPIFSFGSGQAF